MPYINKKYLLKSIYVILFENLTYLLPTYVATYPNWTWIKNKSR